MRHPPEGRVGFIPSESGYWPLRMQDGVRDEDMDRLERRAWGKHEKIPYDYSGGRKAAGVDTGFQCDCATCRSIARGVEMTALN